jgi:hypothetical protein
MGQEVGVSEYFDMLDQARSGRTGPLPRPREPAPYSAIVFCLVVAAAAFWAWRNAE